MAATRVSLRPASIDDAAAIAAPVGELGYSASAGDIAARLPLLIDSDRYFVVVAAAPNAISLGLINAE